MVPEGDEPLRIVLGQVLPEPGRHSVRLSPGLVMAVETDEVDGPEIKGIISLATGWNPSCFAVCGKNIGVVIGADPERAVRGVSLVVPHRGPGHRVGDRSGIDIKEVGLEHGIYPVVVGHVPEMDEGIEPPPVRCHVGFHGIVDVPLDHPPVSRVPYHPEAQGSARLGPGLGVKEGVFRTSRKKGVPVEHPVVVLRINRQFTDCRLKLIDALRRALPQSGHLRQPLHLRADAQDDLLGRHTLAEIARRRSVTHPRGNRLVGPPGHDTRTAGGQLDVGVPNHFAPGR